MERRENQRRLNAGRAEKMHVARMAATGFDTQAIVQPPSVNVGCSGWFYWHWRDRFYPANSAPKSWFPHYAKTFSTVELNAPFYSWPTLSTVQSWLTQAGDRDFVYTVKVCEMITHIKRFRGTKTLVRDFGFIADLLGSRMGCFLFQLPPGFSYTPARLAAILGQLDPARRNVVEFRHKSWWQDRVWRAFEKSGAIFCSSSAPGLPDELIKTADDIYLRFHGRKKWYRHDYTTAELTEWARRVKQSGCRRVWAYFNNDRDTFAIKNASEFSALLGTPRTNPKGKRHEAGPPASFIHAYCRAGGRFA